MAIDGTAFGATQGAGTVEFGATAAAVLSWSDTLIVAEVPAGSTGSPTVTVTNDSGFCPIDATSMRSTILAGICSMP